MSTGSITVDFSRVGGLSVTTISGELDIDSADELNAALDTMPPEERLVVDLSAVEFMDSSGLAVLLRQSMRRRGVGGALQIRRPSVSVQRLLVFCCLEHLLEPEPRGGRAKHRWSFKRP